jgi:hypothetical protein
MGLLRFFGVGWSNISQLQSAVVEPELRRRLGELGRMR